MKNPGSKEVNFHPDAESVYKDKIEPNEQLRSIYDGLTWLIANNYKIGTKVRKNYRVIKSSENIPAWHKQNFDLDTLPSILILYSVDKEKITIEGISLKSD